VTIRATMVKIRRQRMFSPRYAVWDEHGRGSIWTGRLGREGATTEIDGERYEMRREGRKRFVLVAGQHELAAAERDGRNWTVAVGGETYDLHRPSMWRSRFELRTPEGPAGSVRRERLTVLCDLPTEFPVAVQAFIGFVAMALWNREAAAAGGASAGATAATGA
jgi:hypothetical protein